MRKVIAIIEDNDLDREMIETYFCPEDVELNFVVDGEDAMTYLDYNNPSLVILDLNLPKINGFEILEKIKSINHNCIVIILTSSPNHSEVKKAYSMCANSYIVKPIDGNQYKEVLIKAKDFWFNVAKLID